MTTPTYRPGQIVWRDLFTTDLQASERFYTAVFGWSLDKQAFPGAPQDHYMMLKVGELDVGGMMKAPHEGMPTTWMQYVSVTDVDAAARRATEAGGKVLVGPRDIPDVGRFAFVQDPQGGGIHAWKGIHGEGERREHPGIGEFCWEQLNTTDPAKAAAFYATVFGWTEKPMDQDPSMRVYSAGDVEVASAMQVPAPSIPSHWLSYVVVDKLTSAHARVEKNGGTVVVERIDVPGTGTISVIQDNLGATIGIFENPSA